MFQITGNTFVVKDRLRAMGCRWNSQLKAWETGNPATAKQAESLVRGIKVAGSIKPTEDLRIEFPCKGATYSDNEYGVYRYSTYKRGSVLAGQQCREFLGSYVTEELAKAAHPTALPALCGYQKPYLDHLSDEEGSW